MKSGVCCRPGSSKQYSLACLPEDIITLNCNSGISSQPEKHMQVDAAYPRAADPQHYADKESPYATPVQVKDIGNKSVNRHG